MIRNDTFPGRQEKDPVVKYIVIDHSNSWIASIIITSDPRREFLLQSWKTGTSEVAWEHKEQLSFTSKIMRPTFSSDSRWVGFDDGGYVIIVQVDPSIEYLSAIDTADVQHKYKREVNLVLVSFVINSNPKALGTVSYVCIKPQGRVDIVGLKGLSIDVVFPTNDLIHNLRAPNLINQSAVYHRTLHFQVFISTRRAKFEFSVLIHSIPHPLRILHSGGTCVTSVI